MTLAQQHKICTWKNGCLNNVIGSNTEGNSDGIASSCQLYQPTGICVEFGSVVCFTDYCTASVTGAYRGGVVGSGRPPLLPSGAFLVFLIFLN